MACGDPVGAPSTFNIGYQMYAVSVNVGMIGMDFVLGIFQIVREMILDVAFAFIPGPSGKKIVNQLSEGNLEAYYKNYIKSKLKGEVNKFIGKTEGAVRGALNEMSRGGQALFSDNPTKPADGAPTANKGISHTSDEGFKLEEGGGNLAVGESPSSSGGSSFGEALP